MLKAVIIDKRRQNSASETFEKAFVYIGKYQNVIF